MTTVKQADFSHGIPVVSSAADRDARFPTPDPDFRVHNKGTGYLERYTGTQWAQELATTGGGPVVSVKAMGAQGDGSTDDTVAFTNAFTLVTTAGGGTVLVPPGNYNVTGGFVVGPNTSVVGAGSLATQINHSGNNLCFDGTEVGGVNVNHQRQFVGFQLVGNSGVSALGIRVQDCYRAIFRDLYVRDYTAGVGLQLRTLLLWTEGAAFEQVHVRNCAKNYQFVRGNTGLAGTESFAETRFVSCTSVMSASGQVGIDVPSTGTIVYGGSWDMKFNAEATGCTCVSVGAGAQVFKNTYSMYVESTTTDTKRLVVGAGAEFSGMGQFYADSVNEGSMADQIDPAGKAVIGAANGSFEVGRDGLMTMRTAKRTDVNADGSVILAYSTAGDLKGRLVLRFSGPSREHVMVVEVGTGSFEGTPALTVVHEYAFGGNVVLGRPYQQRLNDGTTPHLLVPVSNRNGGTNLYVQWIGIAGFQQNLQLLPAAAGGTLSATNEYGQGRQATVYDVRAFGAKGDGTTDDTAAFNAAIVACNAAGGGEVVVPPTLLGYKVLAVALLSNVTLRVLPGATLLKTGGNAATVAVNLTGSVSATSTTLTADAAIGGAANGATVSVASSTGFAVGDWVLVYDLTYKYSTNGRNQEINRVTSVGVGAIGLANRLIGNYAVANTATIAKLSPITNARVTGGGTISIPAATLGGGVLGAYCIDCEVQGVTITGPNDMPGVKFMQSLACRVLGNVIRDGQNVNTSAHGYSICLDESSVLCLVRGNHTSNCRELPITNNVRHSQVVDNTLESNYDSGINTHGSGCEHVLIARNTINGCRASGVLVGFNGSNSFDTDITVDGNIITNVASHGAYVIGSSTTVRAKRIAFLNNVIRNFGIGSASSWGGILVEQADDVSVHGNIIDGTPTNTTAYQGVYIIDAKRVTVRKNRIDNIPTGWAVRWQNTCDQLLIESNRIGATAGQVWSAVAPASTNVILRNNVCDPTAVGTLAGTERMENNVYGFSTTPKYESNRGVQASVADGGTIAHGLRSTPTTVRLSGSVAGQIVTPTAVDSTNITVAVKTGAGAAGTTQTVYWQADV